MVNSDLYIFLGTVHCTFCIIINLHIFNQAPLIFMSACFKVSPSKFCVNICLRVYK